MAKTWKFLGRHQREGSGKNRRTNSPVLRRISRKKSSLSFESLEGRSLLATASFMMNLYQDDQGTPGAEITGDNLEVGQSFFVEITAKEHDPDFRGLQGVALDIAWDPAVLREVDAVFDPADENSTLITSNLPMYRSGTLNNEAGTIENLSGVAFPSLNVGRTIGDGSPEPFALLRFQTLQATDQTLLTMRQGLSRIVPSVPASLSSRQIYFEPQTITVLAGSLEFTGERASAPSMDTIPAEFATSTNAETANESNAVTPSSNESNREDVPPDGLGVATTSVETSTSSELNESKAESSTPPFAGDSAAIPFYALGPTFSNADIPYTDCDTHRIVPATTVAAIDVWFSNAIPSLEISEVLAGDESEPSASDTTASAFTPLQWVLVAYAPVLPSGYARSVLSLEEHLDSLQLKSSPNDTFTGRSPNALVAYGWGAESSAKPTATSLVDSDAMVDKVLASSDLCLSAADKVEQLLDLIVGK